MPTRTNPNTGKYVACTKVIRQIGVGESQDALPELVIRTRETQYREERIGRSPSLHSFVSNRAFFNCASGGNRRGR